MTNEEMLAVLWAVSVVLGLVVALYLTLYTEVKGELVGIVLLSGIAAPAVIPITIFVVTTLAIIATLEAVFKLLRNQRSNK